MKLVIACPVLVAGLEEKGEFIGPIVPAVPAKLKFAAICGMPIIFLTREIPFVNTWENDAFAATDSVWKLIKSWYFTTLVGIFDRYIVSHDGDRS